MKVGIVDDKAGNRNMLRHKLDRATGFSIVLEAENGADFLEKMKALPQHELPEIVLMDLEMPIMDGVDAIAIGSSLFATTKFIVLTIFDEEEKIFKAIKAGAYGYLLKEASSENIADILVQASQSGIAPISPGIAHKILQLVQTKGLTAKANNEPVEKMDFFQLTMREIEILQYLAEGLGYKEIGEKLFISMHTAKKHVIHIYQKLHVNCRAQALHLAYAKGLL